MDVDKLDDDLKPFRPGLRKIIVEESHRLDILGIEIQLKIEARLPRDNGIGLVEPQ